MREGGTRESFVESVRALDVVAEERQQKPNREIGVVEGAQVDPRRTMNPGRPRGTDHLPQEIVLRLAIADTTQLVGDAEAAVSGNLLEACEASDDRDAGQDGNADPGLGRRDHMVAEARMIEHDLAHEEVRTRSSLALHRANVLAEFTVVRMSAGIAGRTDRERRIAPPQKGDRLIRMREAPGLGGDVATQHEHVVDMPLEQGVDAAREIVLRLSSTREVSDDRPPPSRGAAEWPPEWPDRLATNPCPSW